MAEAASEALLGTLDYVLLVSNRQNIFIQLLQFENCKLKAVCKYFGESGRNGYSRGGEHLTNKEAQDENKSILKLHSIHHHNGREDVNFTMKVTGVHTSCLDRQVTERVNIENFQGAILMNRRNEMGGVRVDRVQYRRWGGD